MFLPVQLESYLAHGVSSWGSVLLETALLAAVLLAGVCISV